MTEISFDVIIKSLTKLMVQIFSSSSFTLIRHYVNIHFVRFSIFFPSVIIFFFIRTFSFFFSFHSLIRCFECLLLLISSAEKKMKIKCIYCWKEMYVRLRYTYIFSFSKKKKKNSIHKEYAIRLVTQKIAIEAATTVNGAKAYVYGNQQNETQF